MRRHPILSIVGVVVAGALLAGCASDGAPTSSSGSASASETSESSETTETGVAGSDVGFEASGSFGDKPELTFLSDTPPAGLQVAAVSTGDGDVVQSGDLITANYLGAVWGSDTAFDNSYDSGSPLSIGLDDLIAGWSTGLVGQQVGSRVLLTIPADLGYGPSGGSASAGIGAEDTIVFVVDILATRSGDASGQADATLTDAEVPVTWVGDLGEAVTEVVVTDGSPAPTEVVATVIAEGTGEPLAEGDQLYFQYTLTTWDNSAAESTWPQGGGTGLQSVTIGYGTALDSLVGIPVGSRVYLGIPASDGEDESTSLALVLDIVGSDPATA